MNLNKKKILFLLFSPLFTKGGHSKNFINLIKYLAPEINKHHYIAYIISYNNNTGEKIENKNKISNISFLDAYKVRILRRLFPSGNVLFQIAEYISNLIRTILFVLLKRPDIVYAYSDKPLYIIYPLKKIFRFKLIYDMRGDILNEIKVRGASNKYITRLSRTYTKALNSVDLIFSVSNIYDIKSKANLIPKYNYYDGDLFQYNESSMTQRKKALGLENKFIFVYTGNIHYYQFLEGIINFFSQFLKKHNDSFLLLITEYEFSKFKEILNKHDIPETCYLLKSLPQNEISELQQVADMGFLLREDLPLNHHSFPTKFAEYLASGVPVLMTPYIHSIAPLVIENDLGEVVDIKDDYSEEIEKIYFKYKNNLVCKKHCSQFAQNELMWQNKSIEIFNLIRNI